MSPPEYLTQLPPISQTLRSLLSPACASPDYRIAICPPTPGVCVPDSPTSAWSTNTFGAPLVPRSSHWKPRLQPGTYVAFALSVSSIANSFPKNSDTYERLVNFPAGRYVGLVTSSHERVVNDYDAPDDATVEELVIHFVTKEPPAFANEVSGHWMPIAVPSEDANSKRKPLQTTTFFPWTDLKQWTTLGVRTTVESLHGSSLGFTLKLDDIDNFDEAAAVDYADLDSKHSAMSLETMDLLGSMTIADDPIPADIWVDVRQANGDKSPLEFVREMEELNLIIERFVNEELDRDRDNTEVEHDEDLETEGEESEAEESDKEEPDKEDEQPDDVYIEIIVESESG